MGAIANFTHAPESDELTYISMALNLINGDGIVDRMGNYAMYNVGYPLLALAPVFLFLGEDVFAARMINVFLGGVTILICYFLAKECGAARLGRLTAAAIWAGYLPASIYTVYLLKENLMTPLMLGVIWCALRLEKKPTRIIAGMCGALFGLLALTGSAGISLAPAVVLALVLTPVAVHRRVALAAIILAVSLIISAPWILRNMHVIGAPVLNTNGGFNFYLGNNPSATGMFVSIADTPRGPTWELLRKSGEFQASETLKLEAIEWARAHPADFAKLALRKALLFWTPPLHEGKGNQAAIEIIVRKLWAAQFVILLLAALFSLFHHRLRNRTFAVLWFSIVSYTAVHMLFYVIFRYREPIMPILSVMAAISIESFLADWNSTWKRQSRRPSR